MMRVCLIGNSHLGCLKLGWDEIATRHSDTKVTFFGTPRRTILHLRARQHRLVPTTESVETSFMRTSDGLSVIDPQLYDAFVICGLTVSSVLVMGLACRYTPDSLSHLSERHLVSDDFFKAILAEMNQASAGYKTAKRLRRITDKPILILPPPMPSEQITLKQPRLTKFQQDESGTRLATLVQEAVESLDKDVAEFVWQPQQTLAHGVFTQHEFSTNSSRLLTDEKHSDDDAIHMNGEFGAAALTDILGRLKGLTWVEEAKAS